MFPRVSIIILNWNGWRDTIECLESLYRITYSNYDVILVDNASQNDSIEKIKEYAEGKIKVSSKFFKYNPHNKPIKVFEISEENARQGRLNRPLYEKYDVDRRMILIKNKDNYGFAGGNNIGMRFALSVLNPSYVLLLNNDVVVDRDFLKELIKTANGDMEIGIVGPNILYYDNPEVITFIGGKLDCSSGRIHHPLLDRNLGYSNPIDNIDLDYLSGCGLLIKSQVIFDVGLLNDRYFLYYEDTEFGLRVKKKGYAIAFVPNAKVWHKVSKSTSRSEISEYYATRNKMLLIREHCAFWQFVLFLFRNILNRTYVLVKLKDKEKIQKTFRALKAGIMGHYEDPTSL